MANRSDHLRQLEAFRTVMDHGSISAAARALGVGQPALSKQLRALETRLHVRLLERNSAGVIATAAGHTLHERMGGLLDALTQLEDDVSASARGVAGPLRVHVPVTLGERHLTGPFIAFQQKFPRVELDVVYDDRTVDLVKERVDVALRVGPLRSPDLVVRKVARLPRLVLATPRYLRAHGTPRTPDDLRAHNYVRNSTQRSGAPLTLARGDETVTLALASRLLVNSIVAVRQLLLEHQGIGQLSRWLVHRDLARRTLVEVLPGWRVASTELHVVYPSGTLKTGRVKALVDFLVEALGRLPGLEPVDRRDGG